MGGRGGAGNHFGNSSELKKAEIIRAQEEAAQRELIDKETREKVESSLQMPGKAHLSPV
jgi:hypothetical protein